MLDRVNTTSEDISKPQSMDSGENGFADNNNDPDTQQFMAQRSNMLSNNKVAGAANDNSMVVLQPMSPMAASSTVVNLLLATGPFA